MKNLKSVKGLRIHFIGIGGVSMSGLCKLVLSNGAIVSGSDIALGSEVDALSKLGVVVKIGHNRDNIAKDIDLVVYTSAISEDNPELLEAKKLKIQTMSRAEFLGTISKSYKKVIAVAGTHGKTTTTSMISEILLSAGLNPTIHIGGKSQKIGSNTLVGGNDYFVVEACEYRESFRYIKPFIGVVINVEFDHPDYYESLSALNVAFQNFASNCDCVITTPECKIEHNNKILVCKDFEIRNLEFVGNGYSFNVFYRGRFYHTFRLNALGYHNVINSLFAIAVAHKLGVDREIIEGALSDFQGVERRYECINTFPCGCRLIIDYAHHPTEIKNSIDGLKDIYKRTLYIFQPHTYSRTLKLFDEFIDVLASINDLALFATYPAREKIIAGGTAMDLYVNLNSKNKYYFDNVGELTLFLNQNSHNYDCVLVLGAGSLADELKRNYTNI